MLISTPRTLTHLSLCHCHWFATNTATATGLPLTLPCCPAEPCPSQDTGSAAVALGRLWPAVCHAICQGAPHVRRRHRGCRPRLRAGPHHSSHARRRGGRAAHLPGVLRPGRGGQPAQPQPQLWEPAHPAVPADHHGAEHQGASQRGGRGAVPAGQSGPLPAQPAPCGGCLPACVCVVCGNSCVSTLGGCCWPSIDSRRTDLRGQLLADFCFCGLGMPS